jgi:hypothetical protein
MALEILPAKRAFLRPGGRDGGWADSSDDRDPDDLIVSPFDFVKVRGSDVEPSLRELRRLHPNTTPIVFGSPHEAGMLFERMSCWPDTTADWIAAATTFDIDGWAQQRQSEFDTWCAKAGKSYPTRGPWPEDAEPYSNLLVPNELMKPGFKPVVIIGLLPTTDPTETAAYLRFGGWNDCPRPPVHMCLARRWRETYGAIQVSNTYETVEFQVAKPVADRAEALELAWLQYHFCTDSIPGTLEESGASLIGSTV